MPRFLAIVHSNPRPGREREYNEWYDTKHLNDIIETGVVAAARRFRTVADRDDAPQQYVTLYEIEADDLRQARRIIAGADDPADADVIPALIESESVTMTFYELVTERVAHDGSSD